MVIWFKDLVVGHKFDFLNPNGGFKTYYKRCEKISPRKYRDSDGNEYLLETIYIKVYNVE